MKYIKTFESVKEMKFSSCDAADAVKYGYIKRLKNILEQRPDLANFIYPNQNNQTLLFFAVKGPYLRLLSIRGSLNSIIELTNAGADWFIKDSDGKYFFDFLSDKELNELKELFPDKFKTKEYKDWELEQYAKKYNL